MTTSLSTKRAQLTIKQMHSADFLFHREIQNQLLNQPRQFYYLNNSRVLLSPLIISESGQGKIQFCLVSCAVYNKDSPQAQYKRSCNHIGISDWNCLILMVVYCGDAECWYLKLVKMLCWMNFMKLIQVLHT